MPRNRLFAVLSLLTLLALVVTGGLAVAQDTRLPPQRSPAPEHATPESALRSSPVMFLENAGQFDSCARFQVRGALGTMWLADDAIWITVVDAPPQCWGGRAAFPPALGGLRGALTVCPAVAST